MSVKCDCHLLLGCPESVKYFRPDHEGDPGRRFRAFARYGDDPMVRRVEREGDSALFREEGAEVNFYKDITPPMPWERIGLCWAGKAHPVVEVARVAGREVGEYRWVVASST